MTGILAAEMPEMCGLTWDNRDNRPRRRQQPSRGVADCVGVDMAKRTCSVPGDLQEGRPAGLRPSAPKPPCKIDGCEMPICVKSRQLCSAHNARFIRYGDPTYSPIPTAEERFWANVDKGSRADCWLWTGRMNKKEHGYGRLSVDGASMQAHVYAYRLLVGPVPQGLELDHICRNHLCVNPAHLEPVTHRVNSLRGMSIQAINARKTHCVNGHEFTPENTLSRREGGRKCKTCTRAIQRAYKQRQKGVS